jgi:hypothetical protein
MLGAIVPDEVKPVAMVTVFGAAALERILDEVAAGPNPPIADWYIGTYGTSRAVAERVKGTAGCRYAPVFAIQPSTSMKTRLRRRVSKADAARLEDAAHAGEIPGSSAGSVLPPRDRRAWGIELGRRFRDELRANRASGIGVDAWQFDEILSECRTPGPNAHREFVGGVLRGLAEGRSKLGDTLEPGFVWSARRAITALAELSLADARPFLEDLDRAARFLVGEEYPDFRGDPGAAARQFSAGHQALVSSPGIRRALGERYVVGMTPGWRPAASGLGGNVDGKPLADVTEWRNGFLRARIAAARPRGYAQYNFVKENVRPIRRLEDAVQSLHHACRRHAE